MGRIALCGVFDIANFGDHLFPAIFKAELKRRGIHDDILLFSPFDTEEFFVEDSHIYSLDAMEQMHQQEPFSAIVVGGGEIIHWHRFEQRITFNKEDYRPYPMAKIWLIPWMMKVKYDVKLLWNAPGIPFDLSQDTPFGSTLFGNIDYLSVRNEYSRSVLLKCGIPTESITVTPDTGFLLDGIAKPEELNKLRENLLPSTKKYVVFHCNRFIPDAMAQKVVHTLFSLQSSGLGVVLLPLAYTHGDDEVLASLAEKIPGAYIPDHPLSLKETIAIFGGSSLYIGTSLHGTVTSLVFDKPVIALDYQGTQKTHDLYDSLGLNDFYQTNADSLDTLTNRALHTKLKPLISSLQDNIRHHFDRIAEVITDKHAPNLSPVHQVSEIAEIVELQMTETEKNSRLESQHNFLLQELSENKALVDALKVYKERADYFEQENQRIREKIRHPLRTLLRRK